MSKLSMEEKDAVAHVLYDTVTWGALCKLLHQLETSYQNRVLSYDLTSGPEGLVIEKARAEGISSFLTQFEAKRDQIIRELK